MSQQSISNDYHYGNEAEQYVFYRFPKALITNDTYAEISDSAKILYGLMLDRMGLSIKNKWLDASGRVFIYFTLEDLQDTMRCGHNKGVKIMAELEQVSLIERKKQGQGKPTIIYVKKFVSDADPQNPKAEMRSSEKGRSRPLQSGGADLRKADTNHTEYNHNNLNDNDPIQSYPEQGVPTATHPDGCDADQCRREVHRRIDYYSLIEPSQQAEDQVNEIVELMVETLCSARPTIQIAGGIYQAELVKARFEKLTDKHIGYVMDCLSNNTTKVRNIKKYLLAALFNAPITIDHYYAAEVNHFYHGGGTVEMDRPALPRPLAYALQ